MSSFGSILTLPNFSRLLIERSSWLTRGVSSVPGASSGTVNVPELIPAGTTRAPTTQPCDAELPGQTAYVIVGVTVHVEAAPLYDVKFGAPAPPAVSACVPSWYPGSAWSAAANCNPYHGSGNVPASLNWVRHGMPLLIWSQ